MASKPILNRMYWATVKAVAAGDTYAPTAYQDLLIADHPDWNIRPYLDELEARYGRRNTARDLADAALWPARRTIEALNTHHRYERLRGRR